MSEKEVQDLIIIGGGPAGLTAAVYAGRAGLEPLVIQGLEPGGQITTTSELENFPGFPEGIGGFDFGQRLMEQAERFDAQPVYEVVENIDLEQRPFTVKTESSEYRAHTVIYATGAEPKKLGLEKEGQLRANGISYCATCDGAFFKEKEVMVVGGGNVALEEANFLTRFASKVYLVHRRDQFRGTKILGDRVKANDQIEIMWNTEVEELKGEDSLEGVVVRNNETDEVKEMELDGLFMAVGYNPRTELVKGQLKLDEKGYVITNSRQETNIEGVYAAGDVQDPHYRQVVTSAASGAKAAMEIDQYLSSLKERE